MNDKIKFPNCGHEFDVEDALSGKILIPFTESLAELVTKS